MARLRRDAGFGAVLHGHAPFHRLSQLGVATWAYHRLVDLLGRGCLKAYDAYVALTRYEARAAAGLGARRVEVVPNGVVKSSDFQSTGHRGRQIYLPREHPAMLPSGLASAAPLRIDGSTVRAAYRRALRTGLYWRLSPEERAILRLSCSFSSIRSPVLARILQGIICKVLPELARRWEALRLGLKVVEGRVRQALALGNLRALEWLKDIGMAVQVGLSLASVPKMYWPEVS